MSNHHDDMYYDSSSRSPSTQSRTNGFGLNRQTSRHFIDGYSQQEQQGYAAPDSFYPRYDTVRDRPPVPAFPSPYSGYDSQTWNYSAANNNAATIGTGTSYRNNRPSNRRAALPNTWMESQPPPSQYVSMPNGHSMNGMSNGQPNGHYSQSPGPSERRGSDDAEELIPTAIVIKNIPFAIKKEQLMEVMTSMQLPLPYAFNYHFDQGVFRGLAFANFSTAEETQLVIDKMNHLELAGRKLRVEYKKMLPVQERERIEREKRERRGQLEEQHRPMQSLGLHNQPSLSSLSSPHPTSSPSPVSMRTDLSVQAPGAGVDFNDAQTLAWYSDLIRFKDNDTIRVKHMEGPFNPEARRTIHRLAQNLGLYHHSSGLGTDRSVTITKDKSDIPPQAPSVQYDIVNDRRPLARAATMDFNESRDPQRHVLRSQHSALLDVPASPALGYNGPRALREAKSFGDLQPRQLSPSTSTSSFPVELTHKASAYGMTNGLGMGSMSAGLLPNGRDDSSLSNGFAHMSLGGYERATSTSRVNGRLGLNGDSHSAGAIGSQRSLNGLSGINGSYEDQSRNGTAAPERQPRGPGSEWGSGFSRSRQNGHAGDYDLNDVDQGSERNGKMNSRFM